MSNKLYRVTLEENQLRGLEAATLILVTDRHGIVCDDRQISRDCFDSSAEYRKAVLEAEKEFRDSWNND